MSKTKKPTRRYSFLPKMMQNDRGVAAVEFALIAPILWVLLVGSVDAVYALTANRKVSLAAQSLGNLVARLDNVDVAGSEIAPLADLSRLILSPFNGQNAQIVVTYIEVQADGVTGDVIFSHPYGPGASAESGTITLERPVAAGSAMVIADTVLPYQTLLGFLDAAIGQEGLGLTLADRAIFPARAPGGIEVN